MAQRKARSSKIKSGTKVTTASSGCLYTPAAMANRYGTVVTRNLVNDLYMVRMRNGSINWCPRSQLTVVKK